MLKKNKKIVVLSHYISEDSPLYGGAKEINIKPQKSIEKGDSCNTLFLFFPNHISTHVDVPYHFLKYGKKVSDFPAEFWFFHNILLIQLDGIPPGKIIGIGELNSKIFTKDNNIELILIKSRFENFRNKDIYWKESPGLHPDLADFLKDRFSSLRGIGVDFISISSLIDRELGRRAHKAFLEKEIIIIEDMKLSVIDSSPDMVIVAPLLIKDGDGAPTTVFAIYYGEG